MMLCLNLRLIKRRLPPLFSAFFAAIIPLLLASCGGGTTGTGGSSSSEFQGKILSLEGQPVNAALVTLEETGDSTLSDSAGNFDLEADLTTAQATLLVESAGSSAKAVVSELPSIPVLVQVSLVLDKKKNSLAVSSKKVTPKKAKRKRTPTPAPSVTPTASAPLEQPTNTPIAAEPTSNPEPGEPTPNSPSPTPLPLDTPTPVLAPTPIPTSTPIPLTVVKGVVSSSNGTILNGAKIGLVGGSKRVKIGADGAFFFRDLIGSGASIEVYLADGRALRSSLEGATSLSKKVVLTLSVKVSANGDASLELQGIRIIYNDQ